MTIAGLLAGLWMQGAAVIPAMPMGPVASILPAAAPPPGVVPTGTPVRLMITREVTTSNAQSGDRFKLRVNENVIVNGVTLIPVGATGWGEVTIVQKNGAVGKGGRLNARLLYVEGPTGKIPLRGEHADKGEGNGAGVALAIMGFGIFGLLNEGDSGRLKAGDVILGFVEGPALSDAARPEDAGVPAASATISDTAAMETLNHP